MSRYVARGLSAALFAAGLAGCGVFETSYELPARDALDPAEWRVTGVRVEARERLTVSENNGIAPNADVVWHHEDEGDRRAQVARIVEDGIRAGARGSDGARRVGLYVEIDRFHGVTPRAVNEAPAAVHDIEYRVWVMDQATGTTLAGPFDFVTDLPAYTQSFAEVAAAEGRTERRRIVSHIARATSHWLGLSDDDPRLQFFSLGL